MKLVTAESMREIDTYCIETLGIPSLTLMENAGVGTVRFIEREFVALEGKRITVICGKGNNGGDGFVIARALGSKGCDVDVCLVGRCEDVGGDARTNLDRLGPSAVVELSGGRAVARCVESMEKSDLVVDALFGTGFKGIPRGLSGTVIGQMNLSGRPVLSVDVPSGLNATTGIAEGECVRAEWTCTMGLPKRGFYVFPGRSYVGAVHVVDIGVPWKAIKEIGIRDNVLEAGDAARLLPDRPHDAHKGTFGKLVILAGSVGYTGAAYLACMSAMRAGAGLVYLGIPESLNDVMEVKLTEVITRPLPETERRTLSSEALPLVREMLSDADAVAVGPGLSRNAETQALVRTVVSEVEIPCVVDADGLNALSLGMVGERSGTGSVVLTPHPGEMARLTGKSVGDVLESREAIARDVAEKERATVVLKGSGTLVTDPSGEIYINPTGNCGLASGGTGDVLTGIIAALLAQGLAATEAAALGAYIHGLAGDLAAESVGSAGMIAGDVMELVPDAIGELAGPCG